MKRIFYACVIVISAFIFHEVNDFFHRVSLMRHDNAVLVADQKTLTDKIDGLNDTISRIEIENSRLKQVEVDYRGDIDELNATLSQEKDDHAHEVALLETLSERACNVRVPDDVRRMQSDRAKALNSKARGGHKQTH